MSAKGRGRRTAKAMLVSNYWTVAFLVKLFGARRLRKGSMVIKVDAGQLLRSVSLRYSAGLLVDLSCFVHKRPGSSPLVLKQVIVNVIW